MTVGALELIVRRDDDGVTVWPGICPHEGATLEIAHRCDGVIQCPWHGRKFRGTKLTPGSNGWRFLNFTVSIENDDILVTETTGQREAAVA